MRNPLLLVLIPAAVLVAILVAMVRDRESPDSRSRGLEGVRKYGALVAIGASDLRRSGLMEWKDGWELKQRLVGKEAHRPWLVQDLERIWAAVDAQAEALEAMDRASRVVDQVPRAAELLERYTTVDELEILARACEEHPEVFETGRKIELR